MHPMARRLITIAVVVFVCVGGYWVISRQNADADSTGVNPSFLTWAPSASELYRLAGANGTDAKTPQGEAIRDKFVEQFKRRYRRHDPMLAVGLRFAPSGRLNLLAPARMEPWNLDQLAIETWKETQHAFGHPFDIDIFITFIGATPVKVGELRPAANDSKRVTIAHFDRAAVRQQMRKSFTRPPIKSMTGPLQVQRRIFGARPQSAAQ